MRVRPAAFIAALCVFALCAAPAGAAAQGAVGIYADAQGSSCSLSDAVPGFIDAYVVVRPGPSGVSAVQFAAPRPSCFTGVFLGDDTLPGTLVAGTSQQGVSVALAQCSATPVHVLTVRYYGYGTTPACCDYPVISAPSASAIEVVDCYFATAEGAGMVSTINADVSCECSGNTAPWPPSVVEPADGEAATSVTPLLAWQTFDYDDNVTEYDVYLGTDASPPLAASSLPAAEYQAGPLAPFTPYYWRVVARDAGGLQASSPVWSFTTRAANTPPLAPGVPTPADAALDAPVDEPLQWRCSDIDGDSLRFDVYFGTFSPPPLAAANVSESGYFPGELAFSTEYFWRVVARDDDGAETPGPEWTFVTRPPNFSPIVPTAPSPWNGAVDQSRTPVLKWWCSDPDGDAIAYDVYFGVATPPVLVASDVGERKYAPDLLPYLTWCYWKIVARDQNGAETEGPVWRFQTKSNSPPQAPSSPVPPNASVARPLDQQLAWACSDADGGALTFDVYFGASSPAPLVAADVAEKSFDPGVLEVGTTYHWRIVARDDLGAITSGSLWNFTTVPASEPPNAPGSPVPGNNAVNRPAVQPLSWQCTDPENDPLEFDLYFGTVTPPPLVAADLTSKSFLPDTLAYATQYYWRVLARDPAHGETSGPVWTFTTQPENYLAHTPSAPYPYNGWTQVTRAVTLRWSTTPQPVPGFRYDVYLGTDPSPLLAIADLSVRVYQPLQLLEPETRYYWRIRVHDDAGRENTGPVWSFTTGPNLAPTTPAQPSPPDGALAPLSPVLTWNASDPEGAPVTFDVYLAPAGSAPALAANGLASASYSPPPLQAATAYAWFVIASDGDKIAAGPLWRFTASVPGDTDQDGVVSVADASCALRLFAGQVSCVPGAPGFSDVNCDGATTPGDALCIHRNVVDGSCAFCDVRVSRDEHVDAASVTAAGIWQTGDTLTVSLRFSGIPVLHAGGFNVEFLPGAQLLDIAPAAGYTDFVAAVFSNGGIAGGYSLDGIPSGTEFARVRLRIPSIPQVVALDGFTDDLAGTPRLTLVWNGTASSVPVTPATLSLGQNRPNPFNPQTSIPYSLPAETPVRLSIHDATGRVVRRLVESRMPAGQHEAFWDGRDDSGTTVSSGIYFYVLDANGKRQTRKMVLLK